MRNTKQRELIYNIVNNSTSHPNAETIYRECQKTIPNISLGTVYRNLNYLVDKRKIKRIKTTDNIDRFDKTEKHNHFYCLKCGKIIDIYDQVFSYEDNIYGNKILDCKINFEGICKTCLEKEKR